MLAANSLFDVDSAVFAALPLFHVNALIVTTLAPLYKGQQVIWAGPLGYRDPALLSQFWRIVEHYRIAAMSAVPTVYATLAQVPVDAHIGSLQVAMVRASSLPAAVRDGFQAHTGVRLLEGYGLTEATCASARSFPDAPRPGSAGQRLPYQRVRIVHIDTDGQWTDVPPGEVGVLAISGPTVFPGYVTGRDGDGHVLDGMGKIVDGWLDTGDLARLDEDGFIYLTGRAKDLIIRGGHNIDPAIIETTIRTFLANDADYVSNTHVKSFPDGMDVQVFRRETLARSAEMTKDPLEREHVTLHIRRQPQLFRPIHVVAPPELHWPELSVTLDERGDYELIRRLAERLGAADPLFGCRDIIGLLVRQHRGVERGADGHVVHRISRGGQKAAHSSAVVVAVWAPEGRKLISRADLSALPQAIRAVACGAYLRKNLPAATSIGALGTGDR